MSQPELGAGDVQIELDGKLVTLRPTWEACQRISKIGGGLNAVAQRISMLDMDTICEVISIGLNLNPVLSKKLPKAIFDVGLINLAGPCIDFVHIIGNGGRPITEDEEDQDNDADPPQSASQFENSTAD